MFDAPVTTTSRRQQVHSTKMAQTALALIKTRMVVDIDQLSPEVAQALGPFCDMTSNQALIAGVVTSDPDGKIVKQVLDEVRKTGRRGDEAVELLSTCFPRRS